MLKKIFLSRQIHFCLRPKLQHFANEATPSHPTHGSHYAKPPKRDEIEANANIWLQTKLTARATLRQLTLMPVVVKLKHANQNKHFCNANSVHETSGEKWRHRGTETTAINFNSFTTFFSYIYNSSPSSFILLLASRVPQALLFYIRHKSEYSLQNSQAVDRAKSCGEGRLR